jgi:transglutaminase-like putative cysteine protease
MNGEQPKWRLLGQLGDLNPIDHGGWYVYEDENRVYEPEAEAITPYGEDAYGNPTKWIVSRFTLEPYTYVNGILSDNPFHPDFPVWFADDIEGIAKCIGKEKETLIADLCSGDFLRRAGAYYEIVLFRGICEFDQYPIEFRKRAEIEARYADHPSRS